MKILRSLFVLSAMFCILIANGQNKKIRLRIINEQNQPVEGVYVCSIGQHSFWYSDTIGVANLHLSELSLCDTLSLLHINYKPLRLDVQLLRSSLSEETVVKLDSDIKLLDEVIVKPLNPEEFVKEAIRLIPVSYVSLSSIVVHADIDIYNAEDSTSLVYFKGALQISQPNTKKIPLVSKVAETERVAVNAKEQLYPIRVSDFASILPIDKQPVIKRFVDYTFDKYKYIQYRGCEAVQLFFHRENGKFMQTGYLIINEENKVIIALQYSTQPMKNVMKSTIGSSLCYTDLDLHKVEVDYSLNSDNLYEFESGTYHVQYTNRRKNTVKSVILNSHLKKTIPLGGFEAEKSIDKLFIE